MTSPNAIIRPAIGTAPRPIESRKIRTPPTIATRLAATEVKRDDFDARADLQATGRGVEGDDRGGQRRHSPWADQLQHPVSNGIGEELERDVRDAEQRAGGCTE